MSGAGGRAPAREALRREFLELLPAEGGERISAIRDLIGRAKIDLSSGHPKITFDFRGWTREAREYAIGSVLKKKLWRDLGAESMEDLLDKLHAMTPDERRQFAETRRRMFVA